MDALELVRSRNRADIELPSGLGATIGLVRITDCIIGLGIPLPVLAELRDLNADSNGHDPEQTEAELLQQLSPEATASGVKLREEVVRRSLKRLAPSVADLNGSPEQEITPEVISELSQEDFDVLASYAMRDTPFPTAGAPT